MKESNTDNKIENTSEFDLSELEQITDDNLDFSALHDGIGFHQKKRELSPEPIPKPQSKATRELSRSQKADKINQLKAAKVVSTATVAAKAKDKLSNLSGSRLAANKVSDAVATASPRVRTLATAIDILLVVTPISIVFLSVWGFRPANFLDLVPFLSLAIFLIFAYFILMESLGGQSIGKFLCKIRVLENDRYRKPIGLKTAFARTTLWFLFSPLIAIASIFIFWRSNYIAWHDKVSRSIVTRAEL